MEASVTQALLFGGDTSGGADDHIILPATEISAYESLWPKYKTVKRMADLFNKHDHALPSRVARREGLEDDEIEEVEEHLRSLLPFPRYSALFFQDFEYPQPLRDAKNPSEILYYQGALDLLSSPCVSVVGTRKPSDDGLKRAAKLARLLVENGFTVMSGLAEGIDTAAHTAAIDAGGKTVGVIGTPLNEVYPKANEALQKRIAEEYLLISQVPFYLASQRDWRDNRVFFPERNKTMSALSRATVIVEASETSGTLFQARAAIQQGRRLFILNSCFQRGLKWPDQYLQKGATKIVSGEEILAALADSNS